MKRCIRPWFVDITAEGLNIACFLRNAGEANIRLVNVRKSGERKVSAIVREAELSAIQDIANRGGWKLHIGQRRGAGRAVEWLRVRWLLAAAALAAGCAIFLASRFMWRIDIADAGAYEADIRSMLKEMGISIPMLRDLVDVGSLRDALEWRYPRVAWFECGWRGMTLVIRPVEGVLPRGDQSVDDVRDVVAMRDGIVKTIVTAAGTPMVAPGDLVRKGDILIRSEERTREGAVKPVSARGSVMARVWEGASVVMQAYEQETRYTGATQTVWTIRTPWFDLWPMEECSYVHFDTAVSAQPFGGMYLPMTLHIETRMEAEVTITQRNMAELEDEAYAAAVRKLYEKTGAAESFIDIWGNCSMIEDGKLLSVAFGERLMEIGQQAPAPGKAAPDRIASE